MSRRVPLSPPPTLTLSYKNNIKICVSIHPHLSCSLTELIYHCVYCMPHSSLFMLWQYKRQQSREVLRTVFVCHRVPFLIPQAPAMPGGAVCGGGSWCKARLRRRFSCCSEKWRGGWAARKPVWFLKSRTPSHEHKQWSLWAMKGHFWKVFVIVMYLKWKRLFVGEPHELVDCAE